MKRILLLFTLLFTLSSYAQTTWVVDSLNDSGFGSLRAAADSCSAGDTIRFNPNLIANGSDSIVLTSGEIAFGNTGISISGLYNTSDTLFISGANNSRIFSFNNAVKIVIDSLVLINGNGVGALSTNNGGAIYLSNCSDTFYLKNSVISFNKALLSGGGIYSYTSNSTNSTIIVNNSLISHNITTTSSAGYGGGGIYSYSYSYSSSTRSSVIVSNSSILNNSTLNSGRGGGIYSNSSCSPYADTSISSVSIYNSSVSDNSSSGGIGGIVSIAFSSSTSNSISDYSLSSIDITNSTISGNTGDGTAAYASLTSTNSSAVVNATNSTISGNIGRGIYSTVSNYSSSNSFSSVVNVLNSTITGNSGRGIYSYGSSSNLTTSEITISGSIIADNDTAVSSVYNNKSPTIISNGFNIFSDSVNGVIALDSVNVSASQLNLESLAFNGGSTKTIMPGVNSVALNNGNPNDNSVAQNAPVVGIRNIGAAEDCYASPSSMSVTRCSSYLSPSGSHLYTQTGLYIDTVITSCGADSLIFINLTINSTYALINETVCYSYVSPSGNYLWTTSGTYLDTIPNVVNCDSIITINLIVNTLTTDTVSITSCDSYTWINGVTYYSNNNTAKDTLVNVAGCDSIVTLNLTINYPSLFTDVITTCDSLTWINGVTYFASNPHGYGYSGKYCWL